MKTKLKVIYLKIKWLIKDLDNKVEAQKLGHQQLKVSKGKTKDYKTKENRLEGNERHNENLIAKSFIKGFNEIVKQIKTLFTTIQSCNRQENHS